MISLLVIITALTLYFLFVFLKKPPKPVVPLAVKLCLSCHTELKAKLKLDYTHLIFKRGECIVCHIPHNKIKKVKLRAARKELCLGCHQPIAQKLGKLYTHLPVTKGFCIDCHDQHASAHRYILRQSPQKICTACHPIFPDLKLAQVHPPYEKGYCADCHDPHGSDHKVMLRMAQNPLCFMCHPTVAPDILKPVQHPPYLQGGCTECHHPHASNIKPLLLAVEPDVCYFCHEDIAGEVQRPSHHPIGLTIVCCDCHSPHSSYFSNLTLASGNDLCYLCHPNIERNYVTCAHNFVSWRREEGFCTNCHMVHGSDFAPLLLYESITLCKSCHPLGPHRWSDHPYGDGYIDPRRETQLTCASSCHDPHGTGKVAMVRWYPDELCLICHPWRELP